MNQLDYELGLAKEGFDNANGVLASSEYRKCKAACSARHVFSINNRRSCNERCLESYHKEISSPTIDDSFENEEQLIMKPKPMPANPTPPPNDTYTPKDVTIRGEATDGAPQDEEIGGNGGSTNDVVRKSTISNTKGLSKFQKIGIGIAVIIAVGAGIYFVRKK